MVWRCFQRLRVGVVALLCGFSGALVAADDEDSGTRWRPDGPMLSRSALAPPERYLAIVLPGSGCAGLRPIASDLFAGLLHARTLVVHPRHVDPERWPEPEHCTPEFVSHDALDRRLEDALRAVAPVVDESRLPIVLIGISEGAEIVPALAMRLAREPLLVVLLAHPGLDPVTLGDWQAARQGQLQDWRRQLELARQASAQDVIGGRSARYWQVLEHWRVAEPLEKGRWPVLRVWGQADPRLPPESWSKDLWSAQRLLRWCDQPVAEADHGVQAPGLNGLVRAWAWIENFFRPGDQDSVEGWSQRCSVREAASPSSNGEAPLRVMR